MVDGQEVADGDGKRKSIGTSVPQSERKIFSLFFCHHIHTGYVAVYICGKGLLVQIRNGFFQLTATGIRQEQIAVERNGRALEEVDEEALSVLIVINLKRRDTGAMVPFVSGWMSYPSGKLVLITPFGGRV